MRYPVKSCKVCNKPCKQRWRLVCSEKCFNSLNFYLLRKTKPRQNTILHKNCRSYKKKYADYIIKSVEYSERAKEETGFHESMA